MIPVNTNSSIQLLHANQNRALAEIIKQATPEQLELMKEGKDLKGLLSMLSKQALNSDKSNTVLLEILKNTPVFKELGSFPDDLRQLIQSIKGDPNLEPLLNKLQSAISKLDMSLSGEDVKRTASDSGIFLESKLAMTADPKGELKLLLQELSTLLQKSELPVAKAAQKQIITLLSHELMQPSPNNDTGTLQQLANTLDKILKPLLTATAKSDGVYGKEMAALLDRLRGFIQTVTSTTVPDTGKTTAAVQQPIDKTLLNTPQTTQNQPKEPAPGNVGLAKNDTPKPLLTSQDLLKSEWIKQELQQPKYAASEPLKQELLAKPEIFIVNSLKETLQAMHTVLLQSALPESRGIPGLIENIFGIINTKSDVPLELLNDTKLMQEIKTLVKDVQNIIQKGDALFTKETVPLLKELALFTKPEQLIPGAKNDAFANDVKALLLQVQDDVQQGSHTNTADVLKQVDKLMMQIDYYQLYSYLSNSSTLYFPYAWDMLEEGSLSFKQGNEKSFYCRIDLKLREFGAINLMLSLTGDKEVAIQGYTEQENLSELIMANLPTLKSALRDAGLTPQTIRIAPFAASNHAGNAYTDVNSDIDMGFEVKI